MLALAPRTSLTRTAFRSSPLRTSPLRTLPPRPFHLNRRCMSSSTAQASQLVDGLITSSQSKVVIFSKSTCPFCDRSKGLFESEFPGVGVEVVETDEHPIGDEIRAYLAEKTGQRTVPNIFIKQKHIGGNDDLMALYRSEKLAELLADMEKSRL